jgi:hypothetical protein
MTRCISGGGLECTCGALVYPAAQAQSMQLLSFTKADDAEVNAGFIARLNKGALELDD